MSSTTGQPQKRFFNYTFDLLNGGVTVPSERDFMLRRPFTENKLRTTYTMSNYVCTF